METSLESRKYIKLLAFVAVALSMTVVTLAFGLEETQAANAVNDYVKQGITNKKWVSPVEQNRTGQIKYKYPYEGGVGKPTKIINHETANNTSTIEGEISYMIRNQESAFVHEFVDANNIIKIADTNYLSWGSGPMGNKTGIQVEQVRMHSKDDFAKEIMNLATFNVNMLKQYGLKPTLGQSNGTGAIWTHAMVTRYLGGTDHVDPDQYWADRASRFFGTTYTINNFQELVEDMYYNRITDKTPANVDATSSVRQENGDFIVDVTVSGDTSRIIEVQVPTWALNNQQKDLKWYQAVQINANTYRATIPISNHKLVDNYLFHTYVRTNDGKFAFKAASSLEYKPAVTTANTTYDLINDKLVITAKLTGDTTRVSRVRFPLWRDPKQKDLVWYTATKKSDDTYEYIYDLKNVPYGAINVHTYVQTDGWQELNKATNGYNYKEPTVPKGKTTAKIEGGTVVLTSTFEGTKEELASVAKVEYPTWSVENASNKIWHLATKVNQTTYQARVDLKTYKRYGNYMTHSYITTTDSRLVNFAATSYAYKQPALPKGKTTAKVEGSTVVLTSTLEGTGEELASVAKVEYPTWSVENTGNKNWHLATKLNKTTYQARVDLKSYKHYGEYMTHSYITTIDNRLGNFAATSYTYKQPALPKGKTTAKVEGSTVVLTSTLEGSEESLASVAKVEYPTWSVENAGNKNWHLATKVNQTTYQARVDLKTYKRYGNYMTHSYLTTTDNRLASFATTGYMYKEPTLPKGTTTAKVEGSTVVLTSSLVGTEEELASVAKVEYPTWSVANAGNKNWHLATKVNQTTYQARVDLKTYKRYGNYMTHSYLTTTDNRLASFAATGYTYKQPALPKGKTTAKIEGDTVVLTSTLEGTAEELASVAKVEYPTWSVANAGNKIWHLATKLNQTTYQARVDLKTYKRYGEYMTHSYITTIDNRLASFATTGYTYKEPTLPKGTTTAKIEGNTVVLTSILEGTEEELASIAKVEYPTWSVANAGNKIWHLATKLNQTTYQARVDLKTYKRYGEYMTHSYLTTTDNRIASFATTGYTYAQPALPKGKTTAQIEGNTVLLTSTFEGTEEELASIAKVEYPTWSVANAGNKIWHLAMKLNETTYQARVDLKTYNRYGEYMTHSYITTIDNRLASFAATSYNYLQQKIEGKTAIVPAESDVTDTSSSNLPLTPTVEEESTMSSSATIN